MQTSTTGGEQTDPLSQFWQQMFSSFNPTAWTGMLTPEAMQAGRRSFLEALAKHCDEYLRSPQFLEMTKQVMDQSLAFRKQFNQFMTAALHAAQVPTAEDTGEILGTLRAIESTVLRRVEDIDARLDRLESRLGTSKKPASPTRASARTNGHSPTKKKTKGRS